MSDQTASLTPERRPSNGAQVVRLPDQREPSRGAGLENETFLAIHKFARFSDREIEIIDHPAFQRLRDVYQLGQTHLVYGSATHKRFEHCLGTVYVAQLMIDATDQSRILGQDRELEEDWKLDRALTEEEQDFIRLGALLHDLGHLPAGHTIEDELGLVSQHSSEDRLTLLLRRVDWQINKSRAPVGQSGTRDRVLEADPSLERLVDDLYRNDVARAGIDLSPTKVLLELVADERIVKPPPGSSSGFRFQVCRDIIGNTICADLLDYLHRDLHHIGKHKELDTRLFEYMQLRRNEKAKRSEFVIYLRNPDNVRSDGVTAILDLLDTRYYLFEIALYHKTKLCATAMLERAVAELADLQGDTQRWLSTFVERLVDCSDGTMLDIVAEDAEQAASGEQIQEQAEGALKLALSLRQRKLHKVVYQATKYELPQAQPGRIQKHYAPHEDEGSEGKAPVHTDSLPLHSRTRLTAMRLLEADFGLPLGSLVMYCAPRKTSTKVAGVNVLFDDDVKTLQEHEQELDASLTGGHLAAQEERFKGLWRVLVACDPGVKDDLEKRRLLDVLVGTIKRCVLDSPDPKEDLLLPRLVEGEKPPWPGWRIRKLNDPRGAGENGEELKYPTGAHALREFLDPPD